jgi:membrane-associated protease RseP (regulator of RpoE activity)
VTETTTRPLPAPPPPPGATPKRPDIRDTPIPVVAFVLGLVALAVFVSVSLVVVILAIVGMIFLHELGHFIAAKRGGMKVTEFFIGFGPRLWSFTRGETTYGLKAIPAGAYVKVIGMSNLEEVPPEDEARTYRQASYPRRMAVALAGSTMHFLLALIVLTVLYAGFGATERDRWNVDEIIDGSGAAAVGMVPGDRPLSVDGVPVGEFEDLPALLEGKGDAEVTLTWERDGEVMSGTAVLGSRLNEDAADAIDGEDGLQERDQIVAVDGNEVDGYAGFAAIAAVGNTYPVEVQRSSAICAVDVEVRALPPVAGSTDGFLGLRATYPQETLSAPAAAGRAAGDFGNIAGTAVGGIVKFLNPSTITGFVSDAFQPANDSSAECRVITAADERRPLSIVGVARLATDALDDGVDQFLMIFAVFNIFIGLFNLLPSLPFDGGHAVIATYERIRSRNGRRHFVDLTKLMPVAYVVTMVMVFVGLLALGRDIYDPLNFGG